MRQAHQNMFDFSCQFRGVKLWPPPTPQLLTELADFGIVVFCAHSAVFQRFLFALPQLVPLHSAVTRYDAAILS